MASGSTPNYAIPYPLQTDPVDVAGDVEQLAQRIDTYIDEWIQDVSAYMIISGTYSNGINVPVYNDTNGTISISLSQDLQSTASPTFVNLNLTGSILTPSVIDVTSATNALRITQKGSGNALLVEDNTNPDNTPFVINADGQIISGTTTAFSGYSTNLQLVGTDSLLNGGANFRRISNSINGQEIFIEKARGSSISAPQIVQSGDKLGSIVFKGFDGTDWISSSKIESVIDGNPSGNSIPGALTFSTTDGSSPTEHMRITKLGYVGINTTSPISELHVAGTITGNTGSYGNVASNSGTINNLTSTTITSTNISTSAPTSANHVATKAYVDGLAGSIAPEIINFDDISTLFDGQTRRFFLTNNLNSTKLFNRKNLIEDPSFEGITNIKYKNYRIGDTGPAGGVIFITPTTRGNTTGKYFEAAPANIDGTTELVSNDFRSLQVPGNEPATIGSGYQDTLDIVESQIIKDFDPTITITTSRTNLMKNGGSLGRWNKYVVNDIQNADFTVASSTVPRSNLVANSNFETDILNWSALTNFTLARSTSEAYTGSASLQCTITTIFPLNSSVKTSNTINISEGQTLTGSFYIKTSASNSATYNGKAMIEWVGSGGSTYSSGTTVSLVPGSNWVRISVTATAPAGSATASLVFDASHPTNAYAGSIFFLDSALLEVSNILLPYFSGTWYDRPPQFALYNTPSQPFNTANSLLLTSNSTSAISVVGGYVPGDTSSVVVSGDQTYIMSFYTYYLAASTNTRYSVRSFVDFFDSGFNLISSISSEVDNLSSLLWNRTRHSFITPSNATYMRYTFSINPALSGARIYLDGLMLEQSSFLQSFFDGDYSDNKNITASTSGSWTYERPIWNVINNTSSLIVYTYTATQTVNVTANSAADLALNYSVNGYSDWFLPSRDELQELYSTISRLRSLYPGINYWSTATFDDELPFNFAMNFAGYPEEEYRGQFFVRPVRYFDPEPINGLTMHNIERIGEKWTKSDSGVTVTRTSERSRFGNSSMKVQLNGSPSGSPLYKQGILYNASSLLPNTTYTFSIFVYVDNSFNISTLVFDIDGVITTSSASLQTNNATWTRIDCTFTTRNIPDVKIFIGNAELTDVANTFYLDAALLEQANQVLSYFDGSNAPSDVGRIFVGPSFSGERNNSVSTIQYYEPGEFKPTNPNRLQLSIYGILQSVSYPEYTWQSMFPTDGFTVDSEGYVTFSEAPLRGARFSGKYIAGNNTTADTNKKLYPFKAIDILLGS